ncbi:MAG: DUF6178 family protein [Acidobacteriota bacterium]|nr:DUF6178 family protein [Acidobacteriota bacterium]MDH3784484.1 DUF6178 family protein [Acidobacteriota bacterium]
MNERSHSDAWRPPDAGIDRTLVQEAAELVRRAPERLGDVLADWETRHQAELALRLDAGDRLKLILNAPRPMRLVRSLPGADFYLTVREIGPTDAIPFVRLASNEQIAHLLDLEAWRGERFDGDRCGAWIALILEAGEQSMRRFTRHLDDELLSLLLHNWLHVTQIESEDDPDQHGHGLSESGTEEGFMAPDGNYRFWTTATEHGPAAGRFLRAFFLDQPERYQRVMWGSIWELNSELEEQAFRWRQSRLDEHGFPGLDDALEIYRSPSRASEIPSAPRPTDADGLAAPRLPVAAASDSTALSLALAHLDDSVRDDVLHGFVSVANHVLVADYADMGDPVAHRRAAEKTGAFVQIALHRRGDTSPEQAAHTLSSTPIKELFREGYELPMLLHQNARSLLADGWLAGAPQAVYLVDDEVRERFEALLGPRPLYLDADDETQRSERRDFRSIEEIETSGAAVEMIRVAGNLLWSRLPLEEALATGNELHRMSTFLLTLMANYHVGNGLTIAPLADTTTADFLRSVASRRTAAPDAPASALSRMIDGLAIDDELPTREQAILTAFGRFSLQKLYDQCSGLDPGAPLDPRYVSCLWLNPEKSQREER